MKPGFFLLLLLFIGQSTSLLCQPVRLPQQEKNDSIARVSRNIRMVGGVQAGSLGLTLVGLDRMWYRDHPRSSFHFYDDSGHWLQMDKLGHSASAFFLSNMSATTFRMAGASNKQSALYGSIAATAFLTTIELLDGFSEAWGFSLSDMGANVAGAILFLGQQMYWQDTRIRIKYSYHSSGLAPYRPDVLGSNWTERIIKDYNGMTFWLSANLYSLLGTESRMPSWLNVSIGHGAGGLLGGSENPEWSGDIRLPEMQRYRRWYVAPDIDFARISTQSPTLKVVLEVLSVFKMPSPALEYNRRDGWTFHLVFF